VNCIAGLDENIDDDDGNGFDSPGWVVDLVVRFDLTLDPEVYTTGTVFA
jgi:hypothetical protein